MARNDQLSVAVTTTHNRVFVFSLVALWGNIRKKTALILNLNAKSKTLNYTSDMNVRGLSKRCHFLAQNITVVLSLHKKVWILNISTYVIPLK